MAADSAIFVGWTRPVIGREKHSNELFQSFLGFLGKQQQAGLIENFEPVLLTQHGGDLNGFVLIRGNQDKLHQLRKNEDWMKLTVDGGTTMQGFGVIEGWVGEGMTKMMGLWQNQIAKL